MRNWGLVAEDDTEQEDATELTKREGPATERPKGTTERLGRGALVGRYVVTGMLGEGGMGVVYSAFDPDLDRKVAIKLLQARAASDHQAWLLREAQAMARLQHPNVIAVHDVGVLPGDRVFVAMELVEGITLRQWLREPRPWRDVLGIMRAAGAGLAAAHASGLVHRDFKPDNVLVGADGRVRVMDFGLARLAADEAEPALPDREIEMQSPLSANLTVAGTLVGTPAYMAPELKAGTAADSRSDQFSFGVALYEALFRTRPYEKDAPKGSAPKSPPSSKVPSQIQRVAMRAIAPMPEARFASMDELLRELARDPGARVRRAAIAGGALLCAVAAVGVFVALQRSHPRLCTGIDRRLAGVWDAQAKTAVHRAFDATKSPYAARQFDVLSAALDRYAQGWTAMATESCEATRVRGDQSEEVLTLRDACLDRRLDELHAVVELLGGADADLVAKSDQIADRLEPIARCSNIAALRAPGLPPTEPRDKVAEMEHQLALAKAGLVAGQYFGSIVAGKRAAKIAEEVHYMPFKAEGLLLSCASLASAGDTDDTLATCSESVWAAVRGSRDDVIAGAAMSAAAVAAQHQVGEARIWLGLARSVIARMGDEPVAELRSYEVEGLIEALAGNMEAALAAQQKALALSERLNGRDSPVMWNEEEVIGTTLGKIGAWEKAQPPLERALALHEQSVGPDHPDIALILSSLGACYAHAGDSAKARAAYERSIAIREKADGPNSPMLLMTLNNMGDSLIRAKDLTDAFVVLERARSLALRTLGKDSPLMHAIATTHAEALTAAARYDEARAEYDDTLASELKTHSSFLAATLHSRGALEAAAKKWSDAASFEQRSIAAFEAGGGKDSPDLWQPLTGLARAQLALGHKDVRPLLERALEIGEKSQVSPSDLAPTRDLLAHAGP